MKITDPKVIESLEQMRQGAEMLRQCFEQNIEVCREIAKLHKAAFDAHIEAGFTEQQAMEIVKARGWT